MTVLELKDMCCYFGGLKAVEKFNTKIKSFDKSEILSNKDINEKIIKCLI